MNPSSTPAVEPNPGLAYLVSQYPSFSHTFILREIDCLRKQGFEIQVASINPPDRPLDRLTANERTEAEATFYVKRQSVKSVLQTLAWVLRHHPGGMFRSLVFSWKLARFDLGRLAFNHFYWLEALIIGRWMARHDLVHLHIHFATPAATVGLIARLAFPIEFSLTVHGPDEFYDAPGYYLHEKTVHAKFLLCISHFARSQLMKLAPASCWDKLHVCRLGVDPESFHPVPRPPASAPFTIVCVGRLAEAKGHLILLRAVRRLIDAGRTVRAYLIGGGPLERELASWIQDHGLADCVTLTGPIDQDHIKDYYGLADCFALASFAEGIPVVLMEAMAMGIPCVTTQITGIPELISNGRDGLLVAPSDDIGLAAALARLMDEPELRTTLGNAGRVKIEQQYHLQRNMAALGRTLRTLLCSRSSDMNSGG